MNGVGGKCEKWMSWGVSPRPQHKFSCKRASDVGQGNVRFRGLKTAQRAITLGKSSTHFELASSPPARNIINIISTHEGLNKVRDCSDMHPHHVNQRRRGSMQPQRRERGVEGVWAGMHAAESTRQDETRMEWSGMQCALADQHDRVCAAALTLRVARARRSARRPDGGPYAPLWGVHRRGAHRALRSNCASSVATASFVS